MVWRVKRFQCHIIFFFFSDVLELVFGRKWGIHLMRRLIRYICLAFRDTLIAPSIVGLEDVKKALACQLVGGSRKRMQEGCIKRGDMHILLIGDPGVGKSQVLKFVTQASPIGLFTSGKGSSSAGLTASVLKDVNTQSFVVEVIYVLNV